MGVKVNIPPALSHLSENQTVSEVRGNNVGQCLEHLVAQFPELKKWLFRKNGELNNTIEVYVNMQSSYPEELAKTVKDGDELQIVQMIVGG